MLNISIQSDKAIVQNTAMLAQWTLKTSLFFGDVYASLEKHFPDFDCDSYGARVAAYVIKSVSGTLEEDPVKMFGCTEIGSTMYDLLNFINGRTILAPTLKELEELRISHQMKVNYLPVSFIEGEGMRFEGLSSVTQVLIAALYYYAYHDLKLVRCKHCGRWFATKSLKEEYCERLSPCHNMMVAGKNVLGSACSCKDAVVIIKQRLNHRKKVIYNNWWSTGHYEDTRKLGDTFTELMAAIRKSPTPENIAACMEYLYSDTMPKQQRPNRRNSSARGNSET